MEQKKTVEKLMRSLRTENVILPDTEASIEKHLMWAWQVGWEARPGNNGNSKRRAVIQMDSSKRKIATFSSIIEAANQMGCSDSTIIVAIRRDWKTHKGRFYWKYAT